MGARMVGGYLYAHDPAHPWLFGSIATMASVGVSALFIGTRSNRRCGRPIGPPVFCGMRALSIPRFGPASHQR